MLETVKGSIIQDRVRSVGCIPNCLPPPDWGQSNCSSGETSNIDTSDFDESGDISDNGHCKTLVILAKVVTLVAPAKVLAVLILVTLATLVIVVTLATLVTVLTVTALATEVAVYCQHWWQW